MSSEVVPVKIRGILPVNNGEAVFLGNKDKVFVIQIERSMGEVIKMLFRTRPSSAPSHMI